MRGDRENLELTLRRRTDGYKFPPVQMAGDPEDLDWLHEQLDHLARELDGRRRHSGWHHKYELIVRWGRGRHEIVVSGQEPDK